MVEPYAFKHPLKRFAARCFDTAGSFLCHFFSKPPSFFDAGTVKKILVIRLDHLGDVLMTLPALRALRNYFPEAQIDFLVSAEMAGLFVREPGLNLIPVTHHWFARQTSWVACLQEWEKLLPQLRHERYDLGIDFRGDLRHILLMTLAGIPERAGYAITGGGFLLTRQAAYDKSLHQVKLNLKLLESLGIPAEPAGSSFEISGLEKENSRRNFPQIFDSSRSLKIVLHPGAGYPSKRWPADRFRELIEKILASDDRAHIILIGTKKEQTEFPVLERDCVTDLRGRTKLEQLPALFSLSHLYIGNDSGPAHLAAAQGITGIIIFSGTNDARSWRPWSEKFQILSHEVPCSPCEAQVCPLGHHDCIQKISVEQVFAAVQTALAPQGDAA